LTIVIKSGLSEAPPTREPSMSGWAPSSFALAAVTEPKNRKKIVLKGCN
jgi:hypothetical protein